MYIPEIGPGQTRIGVSIPVPGPWAGEISAARQSYGDVYAEMIPPHITIVGPTAVNITDIPAIIVQLDNACDQFPAFQITLAGTGSFRPISPVVYLEVNDGAVECSDLAARANQGLLAGVQRFPYHPHVTLAHEVPNQTLDRAERDFSDLQARFTVDALWLYRNGEDGVWRKLCKFELRG
jgi:2'-5' RNA ligase